MPTSQNGWTASQDKRSIGVESFEVNGVGFPGGVRAGDVATIFRYLLTRFDAEAETLIEGWCWGWAYRDVRQGTDLSNHASGTAVDVNAPKHPIGRRGTFTAEQTRTIRKIVASCAGVVRWGGDYSGRPDEMHFEIVGGASSVAALAKTIRNSDNGGTPMWTPNDFLMARVNKVFSKEDAKKYGVPETEDSFANWFTTHCVRQTEQLAELRTLVRQNEQVLAELRAIREQGQQ